ncbi:hypothetical protein RHGRI_037964 [Rhododendron griersonianum]|uniref:Uncharacterized protein n=1 Tax=Rhododendron griersonianum TaxID=479676 RepID=A0AAV6HXA7_9ERIC|nr:hypothetical protein RHGRI_037964 [Rhododendron griersonianum]
MLESNCQLRDSQVKGISLQVVLHPNDTRKEYRKKLRRQKYDNSQSQNFEEIQEEDGIESDSDEQRQAMLTYELQTTIDTGGLRSSVTKRFLTNLIKERNPEVMMVQETKIERLEIEFVQRIRGNSEVEFVVSGTVRSSGDVGLIFGGVFVVSERLKVRVFVSVGVLSVWVVFL